MTCQSCIHCVGLGDNTYTCSRIVGTSLVMDECLERHYSWFEPIDVAFRHLKLSPINLFTDLFLSPLANEGKPEPTEPRYSRRLRSPSGRIRFTSELVDDIKADPEYADFIRNHFTPNEREILDSLLDDAIRDSV